MEHMRYDNVSFLRLSPGTNSTVDEEVDRRVDHQKEVTERSDDVSPVARRHWVQFPIVGFTQLQRENK